MMMTTTTRRPAPAGFVSYVMVLSTGVMLTLLMVFAYRSALLSQSVQAGVNLQIDYSEKEDNVLRSIVAITPNRAIRAMRSGSDVAGLREPLTWKQILTDSLAQANAGQALTAAAMEAFEIGGSIAANPGDSSLGNPARVFGIAAGEEAGPWARAGINQDFGSGFPPALNWVNTNVITRDGIYPIISNTKVYGELATSRADEVLLPVNPYSRHNIINYPKINFGYASPGEPFVAKRNWWSFSMNLAANDAALTGMVRPTRDFVLSIYEIPSQLAISASAFTLIGTHSSGDVWENISVDGNVYASRAHVTGDTVLDSLASRRGMELSSGAMIGGQNFVGNPFRPGVREQFEVNRGNTLTTGALEDGGFFPLSLPSESGRAAFVPITRGNTFFDRFQETAGSNSLSPTTWNNYSIGALQCAMRLDIVECESDTNPTPTVLRFSYFKNKIRTTTLLPQVTGIVSTLPDGYVKVADENQSKAFGEQVMDIAYGANKKFYFQTAVKGTVMFNNARFGDPIVGTFKAGYARPAKPFEVKTLKSGKVCIAFYPERLPEFLTRIGADGPAVNHSLVVNVDYKTSLKLQKPAIPGTALDYGVILEECADLRPFTSGFSLVTNLRLYIGDDFNIVPTTPPTGYSPPGDYYPPCSLFAPEKRYGVEADPYALELAGQVGSLASENSDTPVHLMDSIGMSGVPINSKRIRAELSQIRHPADLPPITMMNWLVVLEELRREFR